MISLFITKQNNLIFIYQSDQLIFNLQLQTKLRKMSQPNSIRNYLQQIVGGGFFLTAFYYSYRNTRSVKKTLDNYKGYSSIIPKFSLDIAPFIANPNLQQNVIIPNLMCKPSKTLFVQHVKYIANPNAEYNGPSYCQSWENFIAETQHNNHKYAIHCNAKDNLVFISSSVLCNLILLQKTSTSNEKLTMYSYGLMRYSKSNNQIQFQPECFTTNRQQIDEVWTQILKRRSYLYFFYGIVLGLGICLLQNQQHNIKIECQQLIDSINPTKEDSNKVN